VEDWGKACEFFAKSLQFYESNQHDKSNNVSHNFTAKLLDNAREMKKKVDKDIHDS
jgi:hypothetical protein